MLYLCYLPGSFWFPGHPIFCPKAVHFCNCAAYRVQATGKSKECKVINGFRTGFLKSIAPLNRVEGFPHLFGSYSFLLPFTFTTTSPLTEKPLVGWSMREWRKRKKKNQEISSTLSELEESPFSFFDPEIEFFSCISLYYRF